MVGTTIGSYRITGELGKGGMGAVYLGVHTLIGQKVAIKTLLPQFCHRQEIVYRFFNEAKAVTAIRHPGIVQIYDFGFQDDDTAYIAMEYLEGETLKDALQRTRVLGAAEAIEITRQIARALSAAHASGVIHRDLKPDNIFLVPDPEIHTRVKIVDFGIAKLMEADDGGHRTNTGAIMGTPPYMSPEQCRGAGRVDARSDLYSLGCILFEMVCGQRPFVREGSGAIMGAHMYEPPPMPRSLQPALSPAMEGFILHLLAKDPDARFASADELVAALPGARAATSEVVTRTPPVGVPDRAVEGLAHGQTTLNSASAAIQVPAAPLMESRAGTTRRWGMALVAGLLLCGGGAALLVNETDSVAVDSLAGSADPEDTADTTDTAGTPDTPHTATPHTAGGPGAPAAGTEDEPGDGEGPAGANAAASDPEVASGSADGPPRDTRSADADDPSTAESAPDVEHEPPRTITVRIDWRQSGAAVYPRGSDETLGTTPLEYRREAAEGEVELVVKKRGYEDGLVTIAAGRDGTERVKLKRTASSRRRAQATERGSGAAKSSRRKRFDEEEIKKGGSVDPF